MPKEKATFRQRVKRYRLEKYTGRASRHTCPSCGHKHVFARFVDITTGDYVADDVGRCNREERCGYNKSVQDANGKDLFVLESTVKKEYKEKEITHTIDPKFIVRSMQENTNYFLDYLYTHFDKEKVNMVLARYKIGTSDLWAGSTIFWQIDKDFDVRTGKIMLYNRETLKRVKQPFNHISWVHTPNKSNEFGENEDFCLTQCFFGEHLLNEEKFTKFGFVESEKTAVLCSLVHPEVAWIATGGVQNINEGRMMPFKDKVLTFYPDKGKAFKVWEDKLRPFMGDYKVSISTSVEKMEALNEGDDIGDYIITKYVKK